MRIILFLFFTALTALQIGHTQTLRDFKKKTETNAKERTAMLDLLRMDIKNSLEQDVVFVVNHFKVYGSYGWMEGTVQRKDGKALVFPDEGYDCCHVEALFKKVNGAWILKQNGAFSTDVSYTCILSTYPSANRQIFSAYVLQAQENCGN
ncbi:MAG: hypothetical protein EBR91_04165 [Flavobacteriia bacterium]|nr:hypothetical protein [Flavobacteriia bacterium]NBV91347.1 hypothetical protein [Flavobacteriia bacterium]NBY40190.1 hypothetical protein [Flavobacteriia bacterium]